MTSKSEKKGTCVDQYYISALATIQWYMNLTSPKQYYSSSTSTSVCVESVCIPLRIIESNRRQTRAQRCEIHTQWQVAGICNCDYPQFTRDSNWNRSWSENAAALSWEYKIKRMTWMLNWEWNMCMCTM